MKVTVISENHTLDQHILKPVVERLFRDLNRRARVDVIPDPELGGVSQALNTAIISRIVKENPMIDLFLLIVDRDCEETRQAAVDDRAQNVAKQGRMLIGCLAIEELEVSALLHTSDLPNRWPEVRKECNPKERYFEPLAKARGWLEAKGRGRAEAMKSLAGNWRALKDRCPEVRRLQDDVADWLSKR